MLTTADFLKITQWAGITTLVFAALTVLSFLLKWGIKFRLVGATGFLGVVTAGLFALSLVPLTRTVIPGAVKFARVYDNGATQAVIAVTPQITQSELSDTLKQAASNLYSFGRLGQNEGTLTIRARTIIHPQPGMSTPLYLGKVVRSLEKRDDDKMAIEIFSENIAQLPKPSA